MQWAVCFLWQFLWAHTIDASFCYLVQMCSVCVYVCALDCRHLLPPAVSGPDSSGPDEREATLRHMVINDPDGSCLSLE